MREHHFSVISLYFSTSLFLSWLTHLWGWIMALLGCTKAAGSFCCQWWQAESPYSGWNNGGLRWYGIVCQCYLWFSSAKICSTTNKISFLKKPPDNKEVAQMLPFSFWKSRGWTQAKRGDHRAAAACEVQVLRGLKRKSNLKRESPVLLLWTTKAQRWSSCPWSGSLEMWTSPSKSRPVCGDRQRDESSSCSTKNKHRACAHTNPALLRCVAPCFSSRITSLRFDTSQWCMSKKKYRATYSSYAQINK